MTVLAHLVLYIRKKPDESSGSLGLVYKKKKPDEIPYTLGLVYK